jgi:hypothetical protein
LDLVGAPHSDVCATRTQTGIDIQTSMEQERGAPRAG